MKEPIEIEKEDINLDAYDHGMITQDIEIKYKGKNLSLIEGITLNAVTDERTNPSEGLQELRKEIEKYYPEAKTTTKEEKTILLYVCPMCGYKYHDAEQAISCCEGQ